MKGIVSLSQTASWLCSLGEMNVLTDYAFVLGHPAQLDFHQIPPSGR